MIKRAILSTLSILLLASFSQAEVRTKKRLSKPISWLTYTYEAPADFKAEGYVPADKPGDNPSVTLNETKFGTTMPLYMSKNLKVLSGLNVAWYDFRFSAVELDNIDTYSIYLANTMIYTISDDFSLLGNLSPGIHSDLQRVNQDDLKGAFVLLLNYEWSSTLKLSGGVAYSRVFGTDEYYPAVGADWQPNDSWSVRAMFPTPGITYFINPKSRVAFGMSPAGGKWNIEDPRTINNDSREYDFEFKGWRLGVGYEYDLTERLTILCDFGTTLLREYTIENDERTLLDSDVDDTIGFRIGLQLHR